MIVSIHQPNFMPWYPFFQKVKTTDVFVILEHCQFEKNNFQNRFNLENQWFTMSVNKGLDIIKTKKYTNPEYDWKKIKKRLFKYNLDIFDDCISSNLSKTNANIIKKICNCLDIDTQIEMDYDTSLTGTERLVDICKKYGGKTYISGSGGKNYMNLDLFAKNNIRVLFQDMNKCVNEPILCILKDQNYV